MWCCGRTPKSANIIRRFEARARAGRGAYQTYSRHTREGGIQYADVSRFYRDVSGILDRPPSGAMTAVAGPYAAAGIGNAVTDLIFSIAKREVTFFSGTAPISFL